MSQIQKISSDKTSFKLDLTPLAMEDLVLIRALLRSRYFTYLNAIIALCVLALGITLRVMTLGFQNDLELLHISLYVGGWIGFVFRCIDQG